MAQHIVTVEELPNSGRFVAWCDRCDSIVGQATDTWAEAEAQAAAHQLHFTKARV